MASGIEMMLKSMGVDTGKIVGDFTALKDNVVKTLVAIDQRMADIEKTQEEIHRKIDLAVNLMEEITAWKRQLVARELNPQWQTHIAQPPLNQPPADQNGPPNPQQQPPNPQP